jgi:hypothetical protein
VGNVLEAVSGSARSRGDSLFRVRLSGVFFLGVSFWLCCGPAGDTNGQCQECESSFDSAANSLQSMKPPPANLGFPPPPFRLDPTPADSHPCGAAAARYLDEIRAWRLGVIEFLADTWDERNLQTKKWSPRARSALRFFLAWDWSEEGERWAAAAPYNLSAFPVRLLEAGGEDALEGVREVFRWRAAVLDLLSDIWDVFDEPDLDVAECTAIEELLWPLELRDRCEYCLLKLEPPERDRHSDHCFLLRHIRAKCPPIPTALATWKDEAEARAAEASAATPRLPCRKCEAMILPTTARATGGLCMPCWQKTAGWADSIKAAASRPCAPGELLNCFRFETTHQVGVVAGLTELLKDLLAVGVAPRELVEIVEALDAPSRQLSAWHERLREMVRGDCLQDVGLDQVIEVRNQFGAILAVLDRTVDRACSHHLEWPANCQEYPGMLKEQIRKLRRHQAALCDYGLHEQAPPA